MTQEELAFLLGCRDGAPISRFERLSRKPNLKTVLGAQLVFGVSPEEIFPAVAKEVEEGIATRAHLLSQRLKKQKACPIVRHKLKVLEPLASGKENEPDSQV